MLADATQQYKPPMRNPPLTLLVVFYEMGREAPRTLHTLSPGYQRGVTAADYEVIAIDAGSTLPLDAGLIASFGPNFRLLRTAAAPSPVAAINAAARAAAGDAIAVCIDGARMLSPGIIRLMLAALRAYDDPLVATLGWHLGPKLQNESVLEGYGQAAEDRLLDTVDWRRDGYELFRISCLAASAAQGWFRPISESNCLAVRRAAWERLGGLDERFRSPGGGLVNLDFYREACERLGELVILLGEGTFHQFHGGVATNVPLAVHPGLKFHEEYMAIRGRDFQLPTKPADFLGGLPPQAWPFLEHSVTAARSPAS